MLPSEWSDYYYRHTPEILADVTYAAERNELTNIFWSEIDKQLDAGLAGDTFAAKQALGIT